MVPPINPPPSIEVNPNLFIPRPETLCSASATDLAGPGEGSPAAGFPPPPSYSTGASSRGGAMKDLTPGKIFHTITYGVNMMGSHA